MSGRLLLVVGILLTLLTAGCSDSVYRDGIDAISKYQFTSVVLVDELEVELTGQTAEDLIWASKQIGLDPSDHLNSVARVLVYTATDIPNNDQTTPVRVSFFFVDDQLIGAWKVRDDDPDKVFPLNIPSMCC